MKIEEKVQDLEQFFEDGKRFFENGVNWLHPADDHDELLEIDSELGDWCMLGDTGDVYVFTRTPDGSIGWEELPEGLIDRKKLPKRIGDKEAEGCPTEAHTRAAAQFLYESGLLFQINREILHPLGLALEIRGDKDTHDIMGFGGLLDYREDPEGILYSEEIMLDGAGKLAAYMLRFGGKNIGSRKDELGYIVQPIPEHTQEAEIHQRIDALHEAVVDELEEGHGFQQSEFDGDKILVKVEGEDTTSIYEEDLRKFVSDHVGETMKITGEMPALDEVGVLTTDFIAHSKDIPYEPDLNVEGKDS